MNCDYDYYVVAGYFMSVFISKIVQHVPVPKDYGHQLMSFRLSHLQIPASMMNEKIRCNQSAIDRSDYNKLLLQINNFEGHKVYFPNKMCTVNRKLVRGTKLLNR